MGNLPFTVLLVNGSMLDSGMGEIELGQSLGSCHIMPISLPYHHINAIEMRKKLSLESLGNVTLFFRYIAY